MSLLWKNKRCKRL